MRAALDRNLCRCGSHNRIVRAVLRAAERLEPADEEICARLKESACITPDETGWRVGGKSAWLHAWVTERATGARSTQLIEAVEAFLRGDAPSPVRDEVPA